MQRTITTTTTTCVAATMAAALLLVPHSVPAQESLRPITVVAAEWWHGLAGRSRTQSSALDPAARADSLHAAALRFESVPARYREAADMHLRSSQMRDAADPQAAGCLLHAGRLLYYADDLGPAQDALTTAGERSQARGDVVGAADAYLDAGFVARERGRSADAAALDERAKVLASSPLLSDAQRTAISSRVSLASRKTAAAAEGSRGTARKDQR